MDGSLHSALMASLLVVLIIHGVTAIISLWKKVDKPFIAVQTFLAIPVVLLTLLLGWWLLFAVWVVVLIFYLYALARD